MSKPARETALEGLIQQLRAQFATMQQLHLTTLTAIVHYVGGELRLSQDDYLAAKGCLLTEELDQIGKARVFRTRRIGYDGGDELARGGLLPPDAGADAVTYRAVLTPEEETVWRVQTIEGRDASPPLDAGQPSGSQLPLPFDGGPDAAT